jgi:hypothetical protein
MSPEVENKPKETETVKFDGSRPVPFENVEEREILQQTNLHHLCYDQNGIDPTDCEQNFTSPCLDSMDRKIQQEDEEERSRGDFFLSDEDDPKYPQEREEASDSRKNFSNSTTTRKIRPKLWVTQPVVAIGNGIMEQDGDDSTKTRNMATRKRKFENIDPRKGSQIFSSLSQMENAECCNMI